MHSVVLIPWNAPCLCTLVGALETRLVVVMLAYRCQATINVMNILVPQSFWGKEHVR